MKSRMFMSVPYFDFYEEKPQPFFLSPSLHHVRQATTRRLKVWQKSANHFEILKATLLGRIKQTEKSSLVF